MLIPAHVLAGDPGPLLDDYVSLGRSRIAGQLLMDEVSGVAGSSFGKARNTVIVRARYCVCPPRTSPTWFEVTASAIRGCLESLDEQIVGIKHRLLA